MEVKGPKGKPNVVVSKDDGLSKVRATHLLDFDETHRWQHLCMNDFLIRFGKGLGGGLVFCVVCGILILNS